MEHYEALLKNYVSVDIIDSKADFSRYDVVVAPMLYMMREELVQRIRSFVENGGVFVMTFYSGLVNENDLAYEAWPPYRLNDVFGIRVEETDALLNGEYNSFRYKENGYRASYACDLIRADSAKILSEYEADFYRGMPAVTCKQYKNGLGFYIACRAEQEFLYQFYKDIINECKIERIVDSEYVEGVMAKERLKEGTAYKFLMNFSDKAASISDVTLQGYEAKLFR